MARPKKHKPEPIVEQVIAPDFDKAVRIYREDIKPAQAKVGEYAQEQSTAYKAVKKDCHVDPGAARLAFRLDNMEETKRDDFLRSFRGLLVALNIFMPVDLVDVAEGKTTGDSPVPTGERKPSLKLVTIPAAPAGDTDLADGDDSGSVVDQAKADAAPVQDAWGVFDTVKGEWMVKDHGDEGEWGADIAAAARLSHDSAKTTAAEFGVEEADRFVARQLT